MAGEVTDDKPPEKTIQQEIVESVYPYASWERTVTDGFMRSCLELVGVNARGVDLGGKAGSAKAHAALVEMCAKNGLPFAHTGEDGIDMNKR